MVLAACGGGNGTQPSTGSDRPVVLNEAQLPDRILCDQDATALTLVLVLRDSSLPDGVSAIGVKNDQGDVLFKVAAQLSKSETEPNMLRFVEVPVVAGSKEVRLNLGDKTALLLNSQIQDLGDSPRFVCRF